MDNSAAFSLSGNSFPIKPSETVKPSEGVKSQAQDIDPRTQQEQKRKEKEQKLADLKEQTELENCSADITIAWFECTKSAKLEVKETKGEIAQIDQRLQRLRRKEKLEQFCQNLGSQEINKLIAEFEPFTSPNFDVPR